VTTTNDDTDPERPVVSEEIILEQFGTSLQQVADKRDTFNTDSCDVCEQLRKDLRTLKSCENLNGFHSEKMQNIIDLLKRMPSFSHKTSSMSIVSCCWLEVSLHKATKFGLHWWI